MEDIVGGNMKNYKYQCAICKRPLFKKEYVIHNMILCSKHAHQFYKYHMFLDNNPRTINNLNEFRYLDENTIEFDCYDIKQNVVARFIIDAEDLQKVRYHKWRCDSNYHIITGNSSNTRPTIYLSRLLMNVTDPNLVVDHINGNPLDNRKFNLRICTQAENKYNTHFMSNSNSHIIGVHWDKERRRWAPEIQKDSIRIHLGRYKDIEEAKYVRHIAEQVCFGEFQAYKNKEFNTISKKRKAELQKYVEEKINNILGNKLC